MKTYKRIFWKNDILRSSQVFQDVDVLKFQGNKSVLSNLIVIDRNMPW